MFSVQWLYYVLYLLEINDDDDVISLTDNVNKQRFGPASRWRVDCTHYYGIIGALVRFGF